VSGRGRGLSILLQEEKLGKSEFSTKSLHSGAISVVAQATNTAVQIGTTICLARLLVPEDFGLVAMVSALTGFANVLMDLGTRDAAVQRPQITHEELSTLFWLTTGLGALFTGLVLAAAPLIGEFYQEDRLVRIAQFWGLTFVITALSCQHSALLRRRLLFQKVALIEVSANVLGAAVAIGIALSGSGYWALVFRPLITACVMLLLIWLNCRWVPGLPVFSKGVKETVKFGLNITGFTTTDYLAKSADRVGLGYTVGARELGLYHNTEQVEKQRGRVKAGVGDRFVVAHLFRNAGIRDPRGDRGRPNRVVARQQMDRRKCAPHGVGPPWSGPGCRAHARLVTRGGGPAGSLDAVGSRKLCAAGDGYWVRVALWGHGCRYFLRDMYVYIVRAGHRIRRSTASNRLSAPDGRDRASINRVSRGCDGGVHATDALFVGLPSTPEDGGAYCCVYDCIYDGHRRCL
jgi:hypothetical protein